MVAMKFLESPGNLEPPSPKKIVTG